MPAGDMDSEYSVGVNNRFIGIESDMIDDPFELIREAQQKPKKEKDTKPKGGKKDAKAPIKNTKEKTVKIIETSLSPTETKPSENTDRPRGERGRGRGRGRGGERGRGRGRGGGFGGGDRNNQSDENSEQQSRPRGPPRGACHRCGEEGHFIRECPQPKSPATPKDNDGGFGSGGGFGAPTGGFGAPSEGFGSPSGGGGGFGAPSGGFGGGFGESDERRGGRGGFRGGRGGRGGRGRGRGGGREFDRRSGSDKSSSVKAFDKKDGSGSYNWGTPQDELAASEEQNQGGFGAPKDVDETPAEDTVEQTGEGSGAEETENKENAEPAQMSFEDYKKQMEENRAKPTYNIRQANEGEKMKGLKQLKKPTEEDNEADGSLFFPRRIYEEKYKTSGRHKETMNIDYQFTGGENRHMDQSRRGGRGRGPRGGRGGNRRDEPFGGSGEKQIQLENNEEFPSL